MKQSKKHSFVESFDFKWILPEQIKAHKKDGWEVLEELKNNDGTKHVPVVICTVLDGDHYRKRAKDLGADGYVNKFHDDLLGEVERILGAL